MSGFTDALNEKIVNHFLRGTPQTVGSSLYLGMFVANPLPDGQANEISYSGYERQLVTFTPYDSTTNTITNINGLVFPKYAGSTVETVTYCGVFDSSTTPVMLLSGQVEIPAVLYPNEVVVWPVGELELVIV